MEKWVDFSSEVARATFSPPSQLGKVLRATGDASRRELEISYGSSLKKHVWLRPSQVREYQLGRCAASAWFKLSESARFFPIVFLSTCEYYEEDKKNVSGYFQTSPC